VTPPDDALRISAVTPGTAAMRTGQLPANRDGPAMASIEAASGRDGVGAALHAAATADGLSRAAGSGW